MMPLASTSIGVPARTWKSIRSSSGDELNGADRLVLLAVKRVSPRGDLEKTNESILDDEGSSPDALETTRWSLDAVLPGRLQSTSCALLAAFDTGRYLDARIVPGKNHLVPGMKYSDRDRASSQPSVALPFPFAGLPIVRLLSGEVRHHEAGPNRAPSAARAVIGETTNLSLATSDCQ